MVPLYPYFSITRPSTALINNHGKTSVKQCIETIAMVSSATTKRLPLWMCRSKTEWQRELWNGISRGLIIFELDLWKSCDLKFTKKYYIGHFWVPITTVCTGAIWATAPVGSLSGNQWCYKLKYIIASFVLVCSSGVAKSNDSGTRNRT